MSEALKIFSEKQTSQKLCRTENEINIPNNQLHKAPGVRKKDFLIATDTPSECHFFWSVGVDSFKLHYSQNRATTVVTENCHRGFRKYRRFRGQPGREGGLQTGTRITSSQSIAPCVWKNPPAFLETIPASLLEIGEPRNRFTTKLQILNWDNFKVIKILCFFSGFPSEKIPIPNQNKFTFSVLN